MKLERTRSPSPGTRGSGNGRSCLWSPRRALTLVEVLAVVIILGLLAATLTVSFRGQVGRAKRELARTGVGVVVAAIETFALEQGRVPTMDEGLEILTRTSTSRPEPYLRTDKLRDPWGRPYQYVAPGPAPGSAYQVLSLGADGAPGGAAGSDDADITSDDLGPTSAENS